jgi:hypothetical protein
MRLARWHYANLGMPPLLLRSQAMEERGRQASPGLHRPPIPGRMQEGGRETLHQGSRHGRAPELVSDNGLEGGAVGRPNGGGLHSSR